MSKTDEGPKIEELDFDMGVKHFGEIVDPLRPSEDPRAIATAYEQMGAGREIINRLLTELYHPLELLAIRGELSASVAEHGGMGPVQPGTNGKGLSNTLNAFMLGVLTERARAGKGSD